MPTESPTRTASTPAASATRADAKSYAVTTASFTPRAFAARNSGTVTGRGEGGFTRLTYEDAHGVRVEGLVERGGVGFHRADGDVAAAGFLERPFAGADAGGVGRNPAVELAEQDGGLAVDDGAGVSVPDGDGRPAAGAGAGNNLGLPAGPQGGDVHGHPAAEVRVVGEVVV